MLANKRVQIRKDIRREQLGQMFSAKRKQLTDAKSTLFQDLFQAVEEDRTMGTNMDLVKSLLACLANHKQHQNAYIIIGNYLFDHKEAMPWFFRPLTQDSRYIEHQMWCLTVMAEIVSEAVVRCSLDEIDRLRQQMLDIMQAGCDITRQMVSNLKRKHCSTQKQIRIWLYFMDLISNQLHRKQFDIPHEAIAIYTEVLSLQLPIQQGLTGELISTWSCLQIIMKRKDELTVVRELIATSWGIFWLVLKNLPQERQNCLQLLRVLFKEYPLDFKAALYSKQLLGEVLYLLEQVDSLKLQILDFLVLLISDCGMDETILLLNLGTHKILTEALEWSIRTGNNQCLEKSLVCIYRILSRLQNDHETKLLYRVQAQIQALHFDQMVEGLAGQPQQQRIWNFITLIIDDFYSSESV